MSTAGGALGCFGAKVASLGEHNSDHSVSMLRMGAFSRNCLTPDKCAQNRTPNFRV